MKVKDFIYDIKYFFKENRKIFFGFLLFVLIGIVIGIFISVSTDSYLSLLTTKEKLFFDYANGKIDYSKQVFNLIINFLTFQVITFLLNLNFYSGLLSYILIMYQSVLLFLSSTAIIINSGFSGVLNVLFLVLPVNFFVFFLNILFSVVCVSRSCKAKKVKNFSYYFDNKEFWFILLFLIIFSIVFAYLINLIYVVMLRKRVFIIF